MNVKSKVVVNEYSYWVTYNIGVVGSMPASVPAANSADMSEWPFQPQVYAYE